MATLQKFKLLATQCAVIGSPTRSPTTSPVIHIRRRKTLRMLLNRRFNHHHRRDHSPDRELIAGEKRSPPIGKENLGVRLKLKDLFISTSPPSIRGDDAKKVPEDEAEQRLLPAGGGGGGLAVARRIGGGGGTMKPLSATIRQRLLMRRAWRPVLVAIPEQSP